MKEIENQEKPTIVQIHKGTNVLAYCADCKSELYQSRGLSQVEDLVLISRIIGHLESFEEEHKVDIIYPRRKLNRIVSTEDFFTFNIIPPYQSSNT
ncbi:MAG: hypothetical protein ABSC49_02275 [Candidatus Microgenomates bacterium]|jgi:hypothetical protein